jgi:hypothetical protein
MTLAVNIRRSSKGSNHSARAARRRRWFFNDLRAIPLLFYRPDCVKQTTSIKNPFCVNRTSCREKMSLPRINCISGAKSRALFWPIGKKCPK